MVNITKFLQEFWLETILLLTGLYYIAVPHSIHIQFSPDWVLGFGVSHEVHILFGVIVLIILSAKLYSERR